MTKKINHLTVREAATKTGKAPSTIYRWINDGSIKEIRVGKRRYVDRKSLAQFLGTDAKKIGINV